MSEKREVTVVFESDRRSTRKDGTHPVKLRVYDPETGQRKRYGTKFYLTGDDFDAIWKNKSEKKRHKEIILKLNALEVEANKIIKNIDPFTFEDFERIMFNIHTGGKKNVNFYFESLISEKEKDGKISTSLSYKNAFDCILRFHGKKSIEFKQIDNSFLKKFESFCIDDENKSIATVGIYLRNLRAVFNKAIEDKVINPDLYPFGKKKYEIQSSGKVKKALTKEQIRVLFNGTPQSQYQAKAKAFWFFSYLCNGMNIKDIVSLKYKDLDDGYFTFLRAKTVNTRKKLEPIKVFLHPFAKQVIEQYGNPDKSRDNYIFGVLKKGMTPLEQKKAKDSFTRSINQSFAPYAKSLNINEPITTYWARHSFSTILLREKKSVALISEALGHTSIETTQAYLDGFEDQDKKEIVNNLL